MNYNHARKIKRKELEETKNDKKKKKPEKKPETTHIRLIQFGTKVPTSITENCPTGLKIY